MASNNNHINDDDIIEQFIYQLTSENFITSLNQHDTAELINFIQSPERLYFILLHLGIPKDLLHIPAYRQLLEEVLCQAIDTIIKSQYAIVGINNNNPNFFKIEIGSPRLVTDSFSLSIKQHIYIIRQYSFRNGTKSESSKTIHLDTKKNIITIQESNSESIPDPNDFYKNQILHSSNFTGILLDSNGFAVYSNKNDNNGNISKLQRNTKKIKTPNNIVIWNGNPLYLNSKNSEPKTIIDTISQTIRRCPNSKDYYISVFGEELINIILRTQEQG